MTNEVPVVRLIPLPRKFFITVFEIVTLLEWITYSPSIAFEFPPRLPSKIPPLSSTLVTPLMSIATIPAYKALTVTTAA